MELLEYMGRRGHRMERAGSSEYKCCCPLHEEKTPSFYINPGKGKWVCHGACGEVGGDLLELIMKLEHVSFPEALAISGTEKPAHQRTVVPVAKQDPLTYEVKFRLTQAAYQYAKELEDTPWAWEYLTDERGLSPVTILRYKLGLCTGTLGDAAPPLGNGNYSTLAGHITVPEFHEGLCIYMQGRRMDGVMPKYMGLHDLPKPLYGYGKFAKERTLYLVEGPFDWLSMLEWGLPVVAGLGSHISPAQVALLSGKHVVLAQDADVAGDLAAQQIGRALQDSARLRPPEPFKDWSDALSAGWTRDDFLKFELAEGDIT
jgi:DNA primase